MKSYDEFTNEGIRDKMTPRTSDEIEERLNGLGIENSVFMGIVKACSRKFDSESMKRINDHSFRYTFRANDLHYTVACFRLPSTHRPGQWMMKVIVTEGRHRPESIIDVSCLDDVMKIVGRGREVLRGLNESLRDKMTPKSLDEIIKSVKDESPEKILWEASKNGIPELVTIAIEQGVDINAKDAVGNSALILASSYGHTDIVGILIKLGADVNIRGIAKSTPLIYASQEGHNEIVEILIENGADVNKKNYMGDTALMGASEWGHTKTMEILLKNGARVNTRNTRGETALKKVGRFGKKESIALLKKYGA